MIRSLAHFLSLIGHPMLVLSYILLLMLAMNPYAFGVQHWTEQRGMLLLMGVFFSTAFIPAIGVGLMKALGFAKTWQLEDKQERIGPYIMSGVFYIWLFKNLYSGGHTPLVFTAFVLGATITLFVCFFINNFTKISAHAAGMGGMVVMLMVLPFYWPEAGAAAEIGLVAYSWPLLIAVGALLAGAVGTARLALGAHTPAELYRGYAAGMVSVGLAVLLLH